jgi:hypothetical protein
VYDAWEAIKTIRVGVERVKEANAEKLRREFSEMAFKPGELVEEFTLRLQAVANQLRILGDDVPDKSIFKRLLHAVPDHLEQVAISIETLMDLDIVSVEEVTSRLRAIEKQKKASSAPIKDASGQLFSWRRSGPPASRSATVSQARATLMAPALETGAVVDGRVVGATVAVARAIWPKPAVLAQMIFVTIMGKRPF